MKSDRYLLLAVVALGVGISGQAFASTVSTGTLTLQSTGFTPDVSCIASTPVDERATFIGTVTDAGEGISDDALSFSLCNDSGGAYDGGIFGLTDPGGTLTGSISDTTLVSDSVANNIETETVQGIFTITGGTGAIALEAVGYSDFFSATTSTSRLTGAGSGTFLIGAPEPATMALAGLGLLVVGFAKRRRKTQVQV